MSRTQVPEEYQRVESISDLKNYKPRPKAIVRTEGESSSGDGLGNLYWWDPSGDAANADGVALVESTVSGYGDGGANEGVWRRMFLPFDKATTDDLDEGTESLYYNNDRLTAGGDLTYTKNLLLAGTSYSGTSFDVSSEDGLPFGVAFNTDGTKMFIVGAGNDNVYEYNLSTGFDISTASYSNTSFDPTSEDSVPLRVQFNSDGTKMFILGYNSDSVYEYNLSTGFDLSTATYSGTSFDVSSQAGAPFGLEFGGGGTKMFIVGSNSNSVYEYNLSTGFDLSTASYSGTSLDVSSENGSPFVVRFNGDGTKMFILNGNSVYEYDLNAGFDVSTATFTTSFDVSSEESDPRGIAFDGDETKMFVVGISSDSVYEYNISGTKSQFSFDFDSPFSSKSTDELSEGSNNLYFTGKRVDDRVKSELSTDDLSEGSNNLYYKSTRVQNEFEALSGLTYEESKTLQFNISDASYTNKKIETFNEENDPDEITFNNDGTKMFIVGNDNDKIYEYILNTGFDISTASYSGVNFDVSSEDENLEEITFNDNGTKMFIVGKNNDNVFEYDLSTGFDLSTASYSGTSFDISSEESNPGAVAFSTDGTKMFILGNGNDSVYEYDLSSGFDVSTASYSGTSVDISSEDSIPLGLSFNDDGTKMFIMGSYNDSVFEYNLSTGFDLSTASYSNTSFDVSSESNGLTGLTFNGGGTKMFAVTGDSGGDDVYEYNLSTGFDLSTASYSGQSFDVESGEPTPTGLDFNSDGTKMFITGDENDNVYEYDLSTGFDLSTASYSGTQFNIDETAYPTGLVFNGGGTKMFIVGDNKYKDEQIYKYNLSTGFNLSTASYSEKSFNVSSEDASTYGTASHRDVTFNDDGTKMFVVGENNSAVYEYNASNYNVFSADVAGNAGAVQRSDGNGGFAGDASDLYVDPSTGKVGINTSSPSKTLDVGGQLTLGGSYVRNLSNVSSSTTTSGDDFYSVDPSGGSVTLTLSSADAEDGRVIHVKSKSGGNTVTIDTEGSETIGKQSSKDLSGDRTSIMVVYNGSSSNWETYFQF